MAAAEHFNRINKLPGKRNGPLGHIGLEVLRELYRIVCYRTGRLEPSIEYLMEKTRRSRAAVVRALAALREHGFLDWIRRTEPTGRDGFGPQVRQITNAYWFALPKAALAFVQKMIGRAPPPDDDVQRRRCAEEDMRHMLDSQPAADQLAVMIDDARLASALARVSDLLPNASSPGG